jgi:twinkle protein
MIDRIDFQSYISSLGLPYKESNGEYVFGHCPYCEKDGEKENFSHFYFNIEKQCYYCQKCGEKGGLYKFKLDRGDIQPFVKAVTRRTPKVFSENKTLVYDNDKFYAWYEKERGIKKEVLLKYQVGHMKAHGTAFMVYQYIDEEGKIRNRKYRSIDKTKMWTEKDADRIYYGLQFVDFKEKGLFIVEGEDDCHALIQVGITNVVSVPYGAGNYTPQMDAINSKFEYLFLLFDCDEKGQEGARKFAEKAGLSKCMNCILPYKDARECVLNGIEFFGFQKIVTEAKPFRCEEIIKASEFSEDVVKDILNPDIALGQPIRSKKFNEILGGIRREELTIITGHTGSGKSNFSYNLSRWCSERGIRVAVFSFENSIKTVIRSMVEIQSGKDIYTWNDEEGKYYRNDDVTDAWIRNEIRKLDNNPIWFYNQPETSKGYIDLDTLLSLMDYAVKYYDVWFFVLDHLHYFLKLSESKNPTQKMDESLRELKRWTAAKNTHIALICHPSKTQDSRDGSMVELGLNSGKGTSSISQESDNFIVVSRGSGEREGEALVKILKNRKRGKTGEITYTVEGNCKSLSEKGTIFMEIL